MATVKSINDAIREYNLTVERTPHLTHKYSIVANEKRMNIWLQHACKYDIHHNLLNNIYNEQYNEAVETIVERMNSNTAYIPAENHNYVFICNYDNKLVVIRGSKDYMWAKNNTGGYTDMKTGETMTQYDYDRNPYGGRYEIKTICDHKISERMMRGITNKCLYKIEDIKDYCDKMILLEGSV